MNAQSPSLEPDQIQSGVVNPARLYQEGLVAGTIGAVTIALWYLLLDLVQGRPLYTPMVLGTVLLRGLDALNPAAPLPVSAHMVIWFTFVHWLVFAALGCIASRLLGVAERNANFGFGVLLLFALFEFGFIGGATLFAEPVLHALAWPTILIGNSLAALAMGWYFWRRHPGLVIWP
jgi:hypothetical protein